MSRKGLPPTTLRPLGPVLGLGVLGRLPLHVVRGISTTSTQRLAVIHHESWARPLGLASSGAGVFGLELAHGGG